MAIHHGYVECVADDTPDEVWYQEYLEEPEEINGIKKPPYTFHLSREAEIGGTPMMLSQRDEPYEGAWDEYVSWEADCTEYNNALLESQGVTSYKLYADMYPDSEDIVDEIGAADEMDAADGMGVADEMDTVDSTVKQDPWGGTWEDTWANVYNSASDLANVDFGDFADYSDPNNPNSDNLNPDNPNSDAANSGNPNSNDLNSDVSNSENSVDLLDIETWRRDYRATYEHTPRMAVIDRYLEKLDALYKQRVIDEFQFVDACSILDAYDKDAVAEAKANGIDPYASVKFATFFDLHDWLER